MINRQHSINTFCSQVWDCSLATQVTLSSNMAEEYGDCLEKGHFYLRESHVAFRQNTRPYIQIFKGFQILQLYYM